MITIIWTIFVILVVLWLLEAVNALDRWKDCCGALERLATNVNIITVHFFRIVADQLLSDGKWNACVMEQSGCSASKRMKRERRTPSPRVTSFTDFLVRWFLAQPRL